MDAHLGFERPRYPGDKMMADLYEGAPFSWCALPLGAEPPSTPGTWTGKVAFLRSVGWGLAPLYLAQPDPERGPLCDSEQQGRADALLAAHRAIRANLVDGEVVYLDVPGTGVLPRHLVDYAAGWFDELSARTPFRPAVRCAHDPAALQLRDVHPDLLTWVVNTGRHRSQDAFGPGGGLVCPDLAECGHPEAIAWQFVRACVTVPFLSAEGTVTALGPLALAVALVADPSRPGGTTPPVGDGRGALLAQSRRRFARV